MVGQVPKFTRGNAVTSSRTLVKQPQGLIARDGFALSCLNKKEADLWNFAKNLPKRNYYAVLSSVTSQPETSLKKTHQGYFLMTFENIFQNTVLCQNTGKRTEVTEVFARKCFRKKLIWEISQNSSKRNCDKGLF